MRGGEARLVRSLAWIAMALAGVQAVIGVAMALAGNPEGLTGAVLFLLTYAVPLFLVGLALLGGHRRGRTVTGWVALVLGLYCAAVLPLNWDGYTPAQAWFSLAISMPAAVLYLVIFWSTVIHERGTRRPTATG